MYIVNVYTIGKFEAINLIHLKSLGSVRFKEVTYAHEGFIYLMKNTVKTVIL